MIPPALSKMRQNTLPAQLNDLNKHVPEMKHPKIPNDK